METGLYNNKIQYIYFTFFSEKIYFQSKYEQQTQTVQQVFLWNKITRRANDSQTAQKNGWKIYRALRLWRKILVNEPFFCG